MNRLIIVGNGFDLAHNLPTRYSDFIKNYLVNSIRKACETRGTYEDELLSIKNKHQGYKTQATQLNEILNNSNSIEELYNKVTANFFNLTFKGYILNSQVKNNESNKWVDIEFKYYQALISNLNSSNIRVGNVEKLNSEMRYIKKLLIEYLNHINYENSSSNKSTEEQFLEVLSKNLRSDYEAEAIFYFKFSSAIVLNFNYTPTVKNYIKKLKDFDLEEIQIHGSLNDEKSIVFGYGDEMDLHSKTIEHLNENAFFEFFKTFMYFQNSKYSQIFEKLNAWTDKFEVLILGHSCGISDRILLNSIFEHKNCKEVTIYYHQKDECKDDYTEKTYEIFRHFNDKKVMREKITPKDKCLPLPQMPKKNQ